VEVIPKYWISTATGYVSTSQKIDTHNKALGIPPGNQKAQVPEDLASQMVIDSDLRKEENYRVYALFVGQKLYGTPQVVN